MFFLIAAFTLVLIVVYITMLHNGMVRLRAQLRNGYIQIDLHCRHRYSLIRKLIEIVRDHIPYEQLIRARDDAMNATDITDRAAREELLNNALTELFALAENHADLKTDRNMTRLCEEMTAIGNRMAFARHYYNDVVMTLNVQCESFPSNLVATVFNFVPEPYFATDRHCSR